jgi:hypothetical protein
MSVRARYTVLTALRWLPVGLVVPVYVRLMLARGLDLSTIGTVMVVYAVAVIALEVPTGGLADTVGPRTVLAAGSALALVTYGALIFAHHAIAFFAIALVHGCERALRSGPLEAWYVSDAIAHGRGDQITRGVSFGAVAEAGALGAGALAAGFLPLLVPGASVLTLPIVVALGCELVHVVLVLRFLPSGVTGGATSKGADSPIAVVRRGAQLAATNAGLRRLLIATAAGGIGLASVEVLWQPRLTSFLPSPDADPWLFGIFSASAFFLATGGALVAAHLRSGNARPARAAAVSTVGYGACIAGLAAASGVVSFGLFYGTTYLFHSAAGPWHRTLLHARTPSAARATMLSVDSLALMLGGVLSSAVLPRVAEHLNIPSAWIAAAAIVGISAVCYAGLDSGGPRSCARPARAQAG